MERTRSKTRTVLLKGCKAHRSERVGIKPESLIRAVGLVAAEDFLRRGTRVHGKLQSDFESEEPTFEPLALIYLNRKKLIRFLESAAVNPEE